MLEQEEAAKAWNLFHGDVWRLHVYGASNNGAGVVLITPYGVVHESALTIDFLATNNEAEYEALMTGFWSTIHLQVGGPTCLV